MRRQKIILTIVVVTCLLLSACNVGEETLLAKGGEDVREEEVSQEEKVSQEEEVSQEEDQEEDIDLQTVKPNEMGEIMVLMYHNIGQPEAEWVRTPDNFKKDLSNLYEEGYRPISLEDYVRGNITTEAGYKPVVLTFDDGNQNNFNMIQDEEKEWLIDPNCAVGILVDFHEKHPDFPLEATFFINGGIPFGQKDWVDYKLNYLVENGMDIGNHTNSHINLTKASGEEIQEEIGKVNELVTRYLPDYEIKTLALPFGSKPKDEDLFPLLIAGEYKGERYENIAILEVGWDPYKSPFDKEFDSSKIRRVRASESKVDGVGIYNWMKVLEEGGRQPYVSDGDPDTITIAEEYRDKVSGDFPDKKIRYYSLEIEE